MEKAAVILIRAYQYTLSPDHGVLRAWFPHGACRYTPTCSEYAIDAVRALGVIRGCAAAARRVLRCHPFAKGGYDPAI